MKSLLLLLLSFASMFTAHSQNIDFRRKIEVIGTAEAEITPDILYISLFLKEYLKPNSHLKVKIEDLEYELQSAVLKAGISKEDFMITNLSSYNWDWSGEKQSDFFAKRQYKIKVSNLNKVNQLFKALDPLSIEFTTIENYNYSKIDELRKELKIKALKDAKQKANYLLETLEEELGRPLEIKELNEDLNSLPTFNLKQINPNYSPNNVQASHPEIEIKKITLRYQIHTIFEIK